MSRQRITARLRKNDDYTAMVSFLKGAGLKFQVCRPDGKGHPYFIIDNPAGGDPYRYHIACSPKSRVRTSGKVSMLRRNLIAAGFEGI